MILTGDCLDVLPTLPEKSVQCVVTSPPYYGLRDYGCDGQIGLEKTPDCGNRGKVRLKSGLLEYQIMFVVQRLRDAGLIDGVTCDISGKG